MRAAVYYNNQDIRIEARPVPLIGPGELLIRVEAAGICGSDVIEWYRIGKAPLVLGHEIAGVVEEAGEGVEVYKKGDRVVCAHHVPCGNCHYCLNSHETTCDTLRKTNFDPGGFCEYLRLAAINVSRGVFPLAGNVSFEEATFVEPLACILRGQRLAGFKPGQSVVVLGSGIAGLLHIKLARAQGASSIIAADINGYRLKAAERYGANITVRADEYSPDILRKLSNGRLADLVIVTTGAVTAIAQALESVERGGTILFFAPMRQSDRIPIAFNTLFWRNEITLTSSYAGGPDDYRQALKLITDRKIIVSDMITHRFNLAEISLGFQLVARAKNSVKVVIYPQR